MKLLDLSLDTPALNLALDEALLEQAIERDGHPEVLRVWESTTPIVVLGRSSPIEDEVNLEFCEDQQIPVLRRCSGGQTVVTGPGCLMYAVVLDYRKRPSLRLLENAHRFVMGQLQSAIARLGVESVMQGTSDLTFQGRKFSGNSLRSKKDWMVYHGTLLLSFDINLISQCLRKPIREPEYRQGRNHQDFLTDLKIDTASVRAALIEQWQTKSEMNDWPLAFAQQLCREKYLSSEWTYKIRKSRR